MTRTRKAQLAAVSVAYVVVPTVVGRRLGYAFGPHCVVRCRDGHVFTTVWVPGVSLTAIRLGWWRFQHCPVGGHWSLVHPVRRADLTADELAEAEAARDLRLP
jgi:hypothetical protein